MQLDMSNENFKFKSYFNKLNIKSLFKSIYNYYKNVLKHLLKKLLYSQYKVAKKLEIF